MIGLGKQGALLNLRGETENHFYPAQNTRPVINTIGAGDALFSAFLHNYLKNNNPHLALKKAILFASYKIGTRSAAEGFLTHEKLEQLYRNHT